MIATRLQSILVRHRNLFVRHLAVSATAASKVMDPIQQLYLAKLKEYETKAADGQIELSPEMQKEIKTELDRVGRVYGSAPGVNMAEFPTFNFPEPKVDAINL